MSEEFYTEIVTESTTITLAEQTIPTSSLSLHHTIAEGCSRSPPFPNSTPPSELATISTTHPSKQSTMTTIAKRSTYPRPSPPGFLYPHPIVPAAASASSQSASQSTMSDNSALRYLTHGPLIIVLTIIALGYAWAGLSLLITTWPSKEQAKERRPLDKPSKYARIQENIADTTSEQGLTIYSHDSTRIAWDDEGMEMKYRPRRRHPSPMRPTRLQSSSLHTIPTSAKSTSTSPLPSPMNLFLSPSGQSHTNLQPRSSSEHLAQHTAFFSPPLPSPTHPQSSTSTYDLATSEIEALEAGTASLAPRMIKRRERKKSWVDLGLAKVEDTVNGVVNRVVRWTDEGKEGVLLPVSNGDGRREVEVR